MKNTLDRMMIDVALDGRTHAHDFDELMSAAKSALREALADGERKGFLAGDWLQQSVACHLQHAEDHIRAITSNTALALVREDISHAICRLAMVLAKREED